MAQVSIAEAARLTGKNRRTIERHITAGKLSFTLSAAGMRQIDISELSIAYGYFVAQPARQDATSCQSLPHDITASDTTSLLQKLAALEAENRQLKERLDDKDRHIDHILALLEHKPTPRTPWWKVWK